MINYLPCRFILRCIRCQTRSKSRRKSRKERIAPRKVVSGSPQMTTSRRRVTSRTMKGRNSTHHLAASADPSSSMIQRVGMARLRLRVHKRISALGLRPRSRQRRSPSSPRLPHQSLGGPCPRSRWTFPLLLRECSAFLCSLIGSYSCSDRVDRELFSAATFGTSIEIDKAPGNEETDDAATSKAGTLLPS